MNWSEGVAVAGHSGRSLELWSRLKGLARASFEQGGGGGEGFWTQNLVYQKWPDQIFPIVNFVFSHYGHFGLGRGGGGFGGGVPPPPLVFNYSKEALGLALGYHLYGPEVRCKWCARTGPIGLHSRRLSLGTWTGSIPKGFAMKAPPLPTRPKMSVMHRKKHLPRLQSSSKIFSPPPHAYTPSTPLLDNASSRCLLGAYDDCHTRYLLCNASSSGQHHTTH